MPLLDSIVGRAFRDEKTGRVVVFPGARRQRGYVVRSESEELRIRSFLKMFYFAHFSILVLGMMVANAWSMFFTKLQSLGRPVDHVLRDMSMSLGIYCLVVGVPYLLLLRSYKKALLSFVSVQDEVVVSGKIAGRQPQVVLVLLACGLLLVMGGIALVYLVQAK